MIGQKFYGVMVAWQWAEELLNRLQCHGQVGIEPTTSVTLLGCSNH